jgi:hypothetical protein
MSKALHEALLRVEHKLDVVIDYVHGMTNVPPRDIALPIPGGGGATGGKCPITGTDIRYAVDTETGAVHRTDGLLRGLASALPVPTPEPWSARPQGTEVSDEDMA